MHNGFLGIYLFETRESRPPFTPHWDLFNGRGACPPTANLLILIAPLHLRYSIRTENNDSISRYIITKFIRKKENRTEENFREKKKTNNMEKEIIWKVIIQYNGRGNYSIIYYRIHFYVYEEFFFNSINPLSKRFSRKMSHILSFSMCWR